MFERFTERARKIMVLAQEEARRLGHDYIGTEHLLLGVLRLNEGVAVHVLASLDVTLSESRERVKRMLGHGGGGTSGQPPFTPCSKRVMELALHEAPQLGHDHIDAEHILLGLLREPASVAARVLNALGADPDKVRREVSRMIGGSPEVTVEGADLVGGMESSTFQARVQAGARRRAHRMRVSARSSAFQARVEGLVVWARCGVSDEERATPQPLRVGLCYSYSAGESDDLGEIVDYGILIEGVAGLLEKDEFKLLETGARMVGKHVLDGFPPVREVTVSVTKLEVPTHREVSEVSVESTFVR